MNSEHDVKICEEHTSPPREKMCPHTFDRIDEEGSRKHMNATKKEKKRTKQEEQNSRKR